MNCIFCKIVAGEVPAHKVYEDEGFLAFLDIRPLSTGHALVIPKEHYRWVWDVPDAERYFAVVKKVAKAQMAAFGVEQVNSKIIGEEVPHAHVWVYPDPSNTTGEKGDFGKNAEMIVAVIEKEV